MVVRARGRQLVHTCSFRVVLACIVDVFSVNHHAQETMTEVGRNRKKNLTIGVSVILASFIHIYWNSIITYIAACNLPIWGTPNKAVLNQVGSICP